MLRLRELAAGGMWGFVFMGEWERTSDRRGEQGLAVPSGDAAEWKGVGCKSRAYCTDGGSLPGQPAQYAKRLLRPTRLNFFQIAAATAA